MARHSDIRVRVGKMFPTCTIGDITQFLTKLVDVVKETEDDKFVFRKNQYTVTRINKTLFMLDKHPQVFILSDVVKALKDFSELSETAPNKRYVDLFFKPGTYPTLSYLTEERCALVNAKLFAAVMRRVHNCHRSGMDSPIYINQVHRGELIGTTSITNIKFQEKELIVTMEIIHGGVTVHTDKYSIPMKRSTFQKEKGPDQIVVKPPVVLVLEEEKKFFNPLTKVKQFVTGLFA